MRTGFTANLLHVATYSVDTNETLTIETRLHNIEVETMISNHMERL